MEQVTLLNGRATSKLGYGCSSVMGGMGRKESLRVLETAFDAGIRHFDVAPAYGYGQAEACLGEFLSRHPGQVTVTTKYGILPAKSQGVIGMARGLVKPIIKSLPGMKQRLQKVVRSVTAPTAKAAFRVAEARQSLEDSLKALRVERIDLWLLHDVTVERMKDESLLRLMEDARTSGKVRAFGSSGDKPELVKMFAQQRAFCDVLQFEWSVFDGPVVYGDAFCITHRALSSSFGTLKEKLASDPLLRTSWSQEIGADLGQPGILSKLMLKAALVEGPAKIVLFSSKNSSNIHENVKTSSETGLDESARRLYGKIQREQGTWS